MNFRKTPPAIKQPDLCNVCIVYIEYILFIEPLSEKNSGINSEIDLHQLYIDFVFYLYESTAIICN